MKLVLDDPAFAWTTGFSQPSTSRLRAWTGNRVGRVEQWVVMLTELGTNGGMSITNGAEPAWKSALARLVEFGLCVGQTLPESVALIEHYPRGGDSARHTFDRVRFTDLCPPLGVSWTPMTAQDVMAMTETSPRGSA